MRRFKEDKPFLTENGKINGETRKRVKNSGAKLLKDIKGLVAVEEGSKYELAYTNDYGQVVYLHIELTATEKAYADRKPKAKKGE